MSLRTEELPSLSNFEASFIDFKRGIRVGLLDESQRITRLLKALLMTRHGVEMVCDRWGRGVYWQWICWVPKPNREAKPFSSGYNFGSAKFFITVDQDDKEFLAGMQIERAPVSRSEGDVMLQKDWDWNVMLKALKARKLPNAIRGLLKEGFRLRVGPFSSLTEFTKKNWSAAGCLRSLEKFPRDEWGMFQVSYAISEKELKSMSGPEITEAVMGVFEEVVPAMGLCMYAPCLQSHPAARRAGEA